MSINEQIEAKVSEIVSKRLSDVWNIPSSEHELNEFIDETRAAVTASLSE